MEKSIIGREKEKMELKKYISDIISKDGIDIDPLIEGYWNNKNCHKIELYCTEFHKLTFSSRISPEFHHRQKKNELHLCNSLIFSVAGAGIEPATSWLWIMRSNQLSYPAINFFVKRVQR